MVGIIYAIVAAISSGIENLVHKKVLTNESTIGYALVWHLICCLILLPVFILEFHLPSEGIAWVLVLASSLMWAIWTYTGFQAYKLMEVSEKKPLDKISLFFVLVLGILFLNESITSGKIIGTSLIFCGALIIFLKKISLSNKKGITYTLVASLTSSIAIILDKKAVEFFTPGTYSFLVYLLPGLILTPLIIGKASQLKSVVKNSLKPTIITAFLSVAYYYFLLQAFKLEEATKIIPILELGLLIPVLGGIVWFNEKTNIKRKLIGSAVIIIGAILVSL